MEETIKRRKVTSVLLGMDVNDEERFPVEQLNSINTIIQRQQTIFIRKGLKWSANKSDDGLEVIVTRIA